MQNGNWVPISKAFSKHLPHNRPYTKMEAAYSLQVDFDNKHPGTISGYAALWQWSRNKVTKFFNDIGIELKYLKNVQKRQNQKGQIAIQIKDRSGTDKGQIRFINSTWLKSTKDRKRTEKGQIKDRSKDTTIDPRSSILDPKDKKNTPSKDEDFYITKKKRKLKDKRLLSFIRFWDAFDFKKDKADAADSWLNIPELTDSLVDKICTAAKTEAKNRPELIKVGRIPKWAQGWLTSKRWEDEIYKSAPSPQIKITGNELLSLGYNVLKKFGNNRFGKWCVENKINKHDKQCIIEKLKREK
jgi:hypothetical protein